MSHCRSCKCANEMPLHQLEQFARDIGGPDAVPERDDERRRFVVNLGGAEFFTRMEEK